MIAANHMGEFETLLRESRRARRVITARKVREAVATPKIVAGMVFMRNRYSQGQDKTITILHVNYVHNRAYYLTSKGMQFSIDTQSKNLYFDGKPRKRGFTYLRTDTL